MYNPTAKLPHNKCIYDRIAVGFAPLSPVGVKECGHMQELSMLVSMLLDTLYIVTLFYCFYQVSAPGEDTAPHGRRLLATLLTDQAR